MSVTFTVQRRVRYTHGAGRVLRRSGIAGTASPSGSAATLTTSTLNLGSHAISAVYGGDGSHLGATSNLTQVVTNNEARWVAPNQVLVVLAPQDLSDNQLTSPSCLFVMVERSGVVLTAPLGVDASQVLSVFGSVLPVGSVVNSWIADSDVPPSLSSGTYAGALIFRWGSG